MAFSTFYHTKITGISVVVPKKQICLEDELEYFGGSLKKMQRTVNMIGIHCRRVADPGVTAADLCQQAAENLLRGKKVDRASIDALIFISQGPDHAVPATACILQNKLGLPQSCAAFDVNQGCTAYTYGLWLASSLIDSRACTRVLLLVGEASANGTDPANRVVTPIFGDCGTASLLEYSDEENSTHFALGTDGAGAEALMIPCGRARFPLPRTAKEYDEILAPVTDGDGNPWYLTSAYMDGGAIFHFTVNVVPSHIKELLAYGAASPETVDWLVLHQANKQIAQTVAAKAGFPLEKAPTATVAKYGNQSGASLPSVIADQLCERVQNGRSRLLLSGFGVGLSWASCLVTLDHIWCSGIRDFETPTDLPSPEELRTRWREKFAASGKQ